MKANGINVELALFEGWVLEDETKLYFFACSDCAFAWIVENRPEYLETPEAAEKWNIEKRWCDHAEARPILALDKSLLDILETAENHIITMKEGMNETNLSPD